MGSSRRSHGHDGLFAPGAWTESPQDEVDRGPAGSGDSHALGGGESG